MDDYTIFDGTGLPVQVVRCPESDLALYRDLLGAVDVVRGQHLGRKLVDGQLIDADVRAPERVAADMRLSRDAALRESDVLALRALEALLPPDLAAYRQALRDYPSVAGSGAPLPAPPSRAGRSSAH